MHKAAHAQHGHIRHAKNDRGQFNMRNKMRNCHMYTYIYIYGHVLFWPCSGKVTRFSVIAVGAGPLWALLGPCGPCWALVGPLGPQGPSPCGSPWALMGRPLMGSLGSYWPGPYGHYIQSKVRFYSEPAKPFGHP